MSQPTDGPSAEEDARSRPGAAGALVPPLPRLGGGSFPKSSSEGAPGDGGRGAGHPGGKAAGGGFGDVPRVRLVMPPVSPRPPPGSSPWRLHQEPVPALVVGGDVDVFSARLLGGETPSVDVVGTFLLLIRVGSFLLQLLPFVFRPPVLEPNFHLGGERERSALGGPGDEQCCNQAASSVPWR